MHAMNAQREDKPPWSAVPRPVREEAEQVIGARIVRAVRKYGGYGPSATFELALDNGRRAFFKGVYRLPEGSGVVWRLEEEELVYERLGDLILPWAPRYFGSIRREGWHALLIEALTGDKVPPWTRSRARRAMRSYAEFHASTVDRPLPEWLTREHHLEFTEKESRSVGAPAHDDLLIVERRDAEGETARADDDRSEHLRGLLVAERRILALAGPALGPGLADLEGASPPW